MEFKETEPRSDPWSLEISSSSPAPAKFSYARLFFPQFFWVGLLMLGLSAYCAITLGIAGNEFGIGIMAAFGGMSLLIARDLLRSSPKRVNLIRESTADVIIASWPVEPRYIAFFALWLSGWGWALSDVLLDPLFLVLMGVPWLCVLWIFLLFTRCSDELRIGSELLVYHRRRGPFRFTSNWPRAMITGFRVEKFIPQSGRKPFNVYRFICQAGTVNRKLFGMQSLREDDARQVLEAIRYHFEIDATPIDEAENALREAFVRSMSDPNELLPPSNECEWIQRIRRHSGEATLAVIYCVFAWCVFMYGGVSEWLFLLLAPITLLLTFGSIYLTFKHWKLRAKAVPRIILRGSIKDDIKATFGLIIPMILLFIPAMFIWTGIVTIPSHRMNILEPMRRRIIPSGIASYDRQNSIGDVFHLAREGVEMVNSTRGAYLSRSKGMRLWKTNRDGRHTWTVVTRLTSNEATIAFDESGNIYIVGADVEKFNADGQPVDFYSANQRLGGRRAEVTHDGMIVPESLTAKSQAPVAESKTLPPLDLQSGAPE